ncbi:MAG: DUF2079 domain-containing protein [Candidatus Altiarchaeota archaeon]|nr:DUF2079 domain-containing protein [Candidatus Altiarchaeota archaeon]
MRRVAASRRLPYAMLFLMIGAYFLVLASTVLNEYNMYWYGNFDLGIPDQGIWLLSRLKDPYLTVRGLSLFGDHASYIHILVAPLYWVWDDVKALLVLHTFVLAIGALPVYLIAKRKLGGSWSPLVFSFIYLMFPALHYSNMDQGYHYESFMVPFMLFGYFFLLEKRYNLFYGLSFLSLICKEEISITFILFGVYIFFMHDRKVGLVTTVGSIVYLLLVMNVLMPAFNQEGAFYTGRTLGSFGDTLTEKALNAVNPFFIYNKIFTAKNAEYFFDVLFPVAFIVFFDFKSFIISGSFLLNLITDWPYAHEIRYHYVTPIIPVVFISAINAVEKRKKDKVVVWGLLALIVSTTLVSNQIISPDPVKFTDYRRILFNIENFDYVSEENQGILDVMALIPRNASVSATYNLVSHLTHREKAYMFPNPFRVNLYGIDDKGVHPDKDVDYVLLDMRLVQDEEREHGSVSKVTTSGKYQLVREYKYVQLWKKV